MRKVIAARQRKSHCFCEISTVAQPHPPVRSPIHLEPTRSNKPAWPPICSTSHVLDVGPSIMAAAAPGGGGCKGGALLICAMLIALIPPLIPDLSSPAAGSVGMCHPPSRCPPPPAAGGAGWHGWLGQPGL